VVFLQRLYTIPPSSPPPPPQKLCRCPESALLQCQIMTWIIKVLGSLTFQRGMV